MAKLILEDDGARRAFNLGDGLLTVGSGDDAKLRVDSADVAAVHLELELVGSVLRVRPRPGVTRPTVDGVEVEGDMVEAWPGQRIKFGTVSLWIEDAEAAAAAPSPRPAKAAPKTSVERRQERISNARPGRDKSLVRRTQPRVKRSVPGFVIVGIVLVVVAGVLTLAKRGFDSQVEQGSGTVRASIWSVERELKSGNFRQASALLDGIPAGRDRTPADAARLAELREEIASRIESANLGAANLAGTKYLDGLKKHEAKWLAGTPAPSKARYFCKLLRVFRGRWPQHPDMGWVDRQEARLLRVVDLDASPTWEDVEWEVNFMAIQSARNYVEAFEILDAFIATAEDDQLLGATGLRAKLFEERIDYYDDKLQQARYEFEEKDNPSKSVWWLVNIVAWIGDEEMADVAASYLVKMPRVEEYLATYEFKYPARYASVLAHPLVRPLARKHNLIR